MMDKGVTVYCASSQRVAPVYATEAARLGRAVTAAGVPLITGAGRMGLMGAVNDAAIEAGATTIGVIPRFMVERGWHHRGLTRLEITPDMHSRKEMMARLSQGAIAMPGGFGTFEELLEIITWRQLGLYDGNVVILNIITWRQLGLYDGNVVILNINGYYDNLLAMIDTAVSQQFIPADHSRLFEVAANADQAVSMALRDTATPQLSAKF